MSVVQKGRTDTVRCSQGSVSDDTVHPHPSPPERPDQVPVAHLKLLVHSLLYELVVIVNRWSVIKRSHDRECLMHKPAFTCHGASRHVIDLKVFIRKSRARPIAMHITNARSRLKYINHRCRVVDDDVTSYHQHAISKRQQVWWSTQPQVRSPSYVQTCALVKTTQELNSLHRNTYTTATGGIWIR